VRRGPVRRGRRRRGELQPNRENVARQRFAGGAVGFSPRAEAHVHRGGGGSLAQRGQELQPHEFAQPALHAIAIDGAVLMPRHYDADSGHSERGSEHPDVELRCPDSLPLLNDPLNVAAPREPSDAREAPVGARLAGARTTAVRLLRTCSGAGL
jgi:hypothetical protein